VVVKTKGAAVGEISPTDLVDIEENLFAMGDNEDRFVGWVICAWEGHGEISVEISCSKMDVTFILRKTPACGNIKSYFIFSSILSKVEPITTS
jgi:hypothetical protein